MEILLLFTLVIGLMLAGVALAVAKGIYNKNNKFMF